jgi:hypothetical protein
MRFFLFVYVRVRRFGNAQNKDIPMKKMPRSSADASTRYDYAKEIESCGRRFGHDGGDSTGRRAG